MSLSNVLRVAQKAVTSAANEINGKILTRPQLLVTDGDARVYCVDVDIGLTGDAGTLRNVPLARANRELVYADVGNVARLRRTSSGQWEVVGFSKEGPGTYVRFPVSLTNFTFGPIEDLSVQARPLTYAELATLGGYGVVPYGAVGIFVGGVLQEIR
jgi:hypothetical protein